MRSNKTVCQASMHSLVLILLVKRRKSINSSRASNSGLFSGIVAFLIRWSSITLPSNSYLSFRLKAGDNDFSPRCNNIL